MGGYHDACGGYHEYRGGCSVPWGTQITKDFLYRVIKYSRLFTKRVALNSKRIRKRLLEKGDNKTKRSCIWLPAFNCSLRGEL